MLAGGIPSQAHVIKDVDVDSDLASTRSQVGARPILVCTGANACGKVLLSFDSENHPILLSYLEYILETGASLTKPG